MSPITLPTGTVWVLRWSTSAVGCEVHFTKAGALEAAKDYLTHRELRQLDEEGWCNVQGDIDSNFDLSEEPILGAPQ